MTALKQFDLVKHLNQYLQVERFDDRSLNGLQIEGPDKVSKISFAVDFCGRTAEAAVEAGSQWLVVHHGWLWGPAAPLGGAQLRWVRTLLESRVGLYAAHLPLDAHPVVGNNAALARLLGLQRVRPFGKYRNTAIGCRGEFKRAQRLGRIVETLNKRLETICSVFDFGEASVRTVGIVSGAAASLIPEAIAEGLDLFITGESSHTYYHPARDAGQNAIFAGHYATETLGLKELARHVQKKFDVEVHWIDCPTGL